MIVVDASVFVKLFKQEEDSDLVRSFVDRMLRRGQGYVAPSIVLYESLSAALHIELPLDRIGTMFGGFGEFGLAIEEPTQKNSPSQRKSQGQRRQVGDIPPCSTASTMRSNAACL